MDYEEAASYWEKQEEQSKKMEREAILKEAERFIAAHNTCALATGCGDFVRCTPIEYAYWKGKFWMLSEGGLKFRALAGNRTVCLAIYDNYAGFGKLGGMQVEGTAELVEPWSPDYRELLTFRKIPEESLRRLSHPMYLIRVTPLRIEMLNSEFKKQGFDSRQSIRF